MQGFFFFQEPSGRFRYGEKNVSQKQNQEDYLLFHLKKKLTKQMPTIPFEALYTSSTCVASTRGYLKGNL